MDIGSLFGGSDSLKRNVRNKSRCKNSFRRLGLELLEDRRVLNSAPMIVDNLDPGFSKTGNWNLASGLGYMSSYHYASAPFDGSEVANWAFNVEPGTYRVSATWHTANVYHASNTPIKIFDGSTQVGFVALNQQPAPNDFFESNAWWESIGTFTVGSILNVQMSDLANSHIIADAFRIEKVTPVSSIGILDNLSSGFAKSGTWNTTNGQGFASSVYWSELPYNGNDVAEWTFVVQPGTYRVAATWTGPHSGLGSNVPIQIYDGSTLVSNVTLNQKPAPDDFSDNGVFWENIGTFVATSTLRIRMSDNTNGAALADAFRIERTQLPSIVDNLNPGFSRTGNWWLSNNVGYANSTFVSNSPYDGIDTATWTFNVQPGVYRIASTWYGGNPEHGVSIPIQVFDGSVSVGSTTLNQQFSPNDFVDASVWWENLGVFTVIGNTLSVRMTEHSSGVAIADAVRIERIVPVSTTAIIDNLNSGFAKSNNWNTTNGQGYASSVYWSNLPYSGDDVAEWTFVVQPGTYRVAATWTGPHSGLGSNVPIQVYDGSTLVSNVTLNQKPAPDDFSDSGVFWENIGTFTVNTILRIRMSDNTNGAALADAFRIQNVTTNPARARPIALLDTKYYTPVGVDLIVGSAASVLANDNSIDTVQTWAKLSSYPLNGSLISFGANGTFTYRPNPGFTGTDSFTYR